MWKEGDFLQSEDEKSFLRLKNQAYQIEDPLWTYESDENAKKVFYT